MRNRPGLEAEACYGLGLIEYCCNSLDSSEAYFCKATQVDPTHADAYYQLAKIADTRGDPVTATLYLRTALAQNPGHVMAAEALGEHDEQVGSQLEPSSHRDNSQVAQTHSSPAGGALTSVGLNWKTVVSMITLAALAISLVQGA
jgi:tetratricopeptide (TPR) repeat protein